METQTIGIPPLIGQLARQWCKVNLPVKVLQSGAGWYLGTFDHEGPCSRESREYFPSREAAEAALKAGTWTQRSQP